KPSTAALEHTHPMITRLHATAKRRPGRTAIKGPRDSNSSTIGKQEHAKRAAPMGNGSCGILLPGIRLGWRIAAEIAPSVGQEPENASCQRNYQNRQPQKQRNCEGLLDRDAHEAQTNDQPAFAHAPS